MRAAMGALVVAMVLAIGLLVAIEPGQAQRVNTGVSNLPTGIQPDQKKVYDITFSGIGPLEVRILEIDRNGRWMYVEFDEAIYDLPDRTWVNIEQIAMINPSEQEHRW